jgi:DMSO reductase anchor subunit
MELLIGLGAIISVIGIVGIVLSILQVRRAKKTAQSDEDLKAQVQAAMPLNLGSFLLSVLGLMCVMVGVILA